MYSPKQMQNSQASRGRRGKTTEGAYHKEVKFRREPKGWKLLSRARTPFRRSEFTYRSQ